MFFGGGGRHFRFGLFNQGTNCMTYTSSFDDFSIHSHSVLWSFKKVERFDFLKFGRLPSFVETYLDMITFSGSYLVCLTF